MIGEVSEHTLEVGGSVRWYTKIMLRIALALVVLNSAVNTGHAGPLRRIEVKIDATTEVEVGHLIGFACDHPKLIEARMTTRKDARGEVNVFSVKGVTTGTTQCRVGNDAMGGSQLFEVVVREKR